MAANQYSCVPRDIEAIRAALQQADTVQDALSKYTADTKHHLGTRALRDWFAAEGLPPPSTFLRPRVDARAYVDGRAQRRDHVAHTIRAGVYDQYFERWDQLLDRAKLTPCPALLKGKSGKPTKRVDSLTLSDLHFGADLLPITTGGPRYTAVEEARSLAKVTSDFCDYKIQYRDQSSALVSILGDLSDGKLHSITNGARAAEQWWRAYFLLRQSLTHIARAYTKVHVVCQTGNHDRILYIHPGRATQNKSDSEAWKIYMALRDYFAENNPHVTFQIDHTPFSIVHVFRHKIHATHGDTGRPRQGNPHSKINVERLQHDVLKIQSQHHAHPIGMFVQGHAHKSFNIELDGGEIFIGNGSLLPSAEYVGVTHTPCSQTILEITEDYVCGDYRRSTVSESDRNDAKLDAIIKPYITEVR